MNTAELNTLRIDLRKVIDDFDLRILSGEVLSKQEIVDLILIRDKHDALCILLMEQL